MIKRSFEVVFKKSTFISYFFEINDKTKVREIHALLKKEHKKAKHVCYGYLIINNGVENGGFSDDGEPSNSAGKVIYDLIRIKNLTNILVVVVRYFGGTLLGFGGLQKAYRQSAKLAIDNYLEGKKYDKNS